jgi:hypothetical protein
MNTRPKSRDYELLSHFALTRPTVTQCIHQGQILV